MKKVFFLLCLLLTVISGVQAAELNYSKAENWAYLETEQVSKTADVFLICPTVLFKDAGNADIAQADFRYKFTGALNMERGIYDQNARLFAPFYRQATLPVYYLPAAEARPYFVRAYKDLARSFRYYLKHYNNDRPLIIAGFSQGAQMALRLIEEFRPYGSFRKNIVAVYAIGYHLTDKQAQNIRGLHPASGAADNHAIVVFNTEAANINSSLLVPQGIKSHCINPLNWRTDATPAARTANKGSCFTNYEANINKEIPALTGAYIDTSRGVIKVPDIRSADYPAYILPDGVFHIYDYQFFYRNLQENVRTRLQSFLLQQEQK